jgi:hypothetical protein
MSELVQRVPFVGASEDAHGNEAETWGAAVDLPGRYGFDPGSSSEPRLAGQGRVIVEPTLYGPFDMPFVPRDRAIVRGLTYEVEGEVRRWRNMFSNHEPGAVVSLRRVTG